MQKIEQDISDLKTRLAVAERDISVIMKKLDKIDSNTTWIVRLLVGGFVVAILGFVIRGGTNL